MRRRAFIGILSAAVGLPVVSLGQQTKRVPRVGVLMMVDLRASLPQGSSG